MSRAWSLLVAVHWALWLSAWQVESECGIGQVSGEATFLQRPFIRYDNHNYVLRDEDKPVFMKCEMTLVLTSR